MYIVISFWLYVMLSLLKFLKIVLQRCFLRLSYFPGSNTRNNTFIVIGWNKEGKLVARSHNFHDGRPASTSKGSAAGRIVAIGH